MNEQDWIKLKTDCELYKNKIDAMEKNQVEHEKRIAELEMRNARTDFQYDQIMKMLDTLNEKTIPALSKEIQALKNRPVERYNAVVASIISTIVGAIIGFVCSKIFS